LRQFERDRAGLLERRGGANRQESCTLRIDADASGGAMAHPTRHPVTL